MDVELKEFDIPPERNIPDSPCGKLPDWDWKLGNFRQDDSIAGTSIRRGYFDCASYFYDGTFNVVKFPKGLTLFTGSGNLVNANAEFPLGPQYYTPFDLKPGATNIPINPIDYAGVNLSIEDSISDSFKISPGWFADLDTAKMYSADPNSSGFSGICGDRCVLAYKLKQDVVMYLLNDSYNIAKLFNAPDNIVPQPVKNALARMFDIGDRTPVRTDSEDPFQRFYYRKSRFSRRDLDKIFADWFCEKISPNDNYAGYCATFQNSVAHRGVFHLEFIFCNAVKWLKRDLNNQHDWQYNSERYPNEVKKYIEQISLYKTINYNFHAGNLLEHSVWTLLYFETLLKQYPNWFNEDQKRFLGFVAFIHDIGKVAPTDEGMRTNQIRKEFIYFSIFPHPTIGARYVRGELQFPTFNPDLSPSEFPLDMGNLFRDFGCEYVHENVIVASVIIELHWDFGSLIEEFNRSGGTDQEFLIKLLHGYFAKVWLEFNKYYPRFRREEDDIRKNFFTLTLLGLVLISIADILGNQAYGIGRLELGNLASLNKRSGIFPFIRNLPRKYRGSNIAEVSKIRGLGMYCAGTLHDFIFNMSLVAFNNYVRRISN